MRARFKCKLCGYKSSVKQQVHKHVVKVHYNEENSGDLVKLKRSNTCYSCSVCGVEEESFHQMLEHMKVLHSDFLKEQRDRNDRRKRRTRSQPQVLFQCEKCKFSSSHQSSLGRHVLESHGPIDWFLCTFCEKKFKRIDNLRDHSRRIHGSTGEY